MKGTKLFVSLILWLAAGTLAHSQVIVTENDALEATKKIFSGKDYDCYLINEKNDTYRRLLVDFDPMSGWGHECHVVSVPKTAASIPEGLYAVSYILGEKVIESVKIVK